MKVAIAPTMTNVKWRVFFSSVELIILGGTGGEGKHIAQCGKVDRSGLVQGRFSLV